MRELIKEIPYYIQVSRILRREIIAGKYSLNSKFPDELELAGRFGISKDVIRVSLRELAGEGLLVRIRRKGTFVSDNIKRHDPLFVHLTLFQFTVPASILTAAVQDGIAGTGLFLSVRHMPCNDIETEKTFLVESITSRCAAFIISPAVRNEDDSDNSASFSELAKRGIPLIFLDRTMSDDAGGDLICFDNTAAVYDMVADTLRQGLHNCTFFYTDSPDRVSRERNAGAFKAFSDFGISPDEKNIIRIPNRPGLDFPKEAFDAFTAKNPDSDTLIFSGENYMAFDFYNLLRNNSPRRKMKKIVSTASALPMNDNDFNRLNTSYYRLYDDFYEPLRNTLRKRLNGEIPDGIRVVHKIKYVPMTAKQADSYYRKKLKPPLP